jgi:hypothetical protein
MYLRTSDGLGQAPPKKRRTEGSVTPPPKKKFRGPPAEGAPKRPSVRPPPRPQMPEDRLIRVTAGWRLYVPFREDFAAFRQEVAQAVARHNAKATSNMDEQKLKAIHDELRRRSPKFDEFDIIPLRADIWFIKMGDKESNSVIFSPGMLIYSQGSSP